MASRNRCDAQAGVILHQHPYRETSLILEVFTRQYGRISIVARGARRPQSALRGVLLPFQPLIFSWFGAGEVKTLHKADWVGGVPQLAGRPLICAFYLNELLLRMLARDDPHEHLYDLYTQTIDVLSRQENLDVEPVLRQFEYGLLRETGFEPQLELDSQGNLLTDQQQYHYLPGAGIVSKPGHGTVTITAEAVQDLRAGIFDRASSAGYIKFLMRALLNNVLANPELHTRYLMRELNTLNLESPK